ncbi:hypothetical protein HX001_13730 [Empedobacter brevis]|uniref:Uncharacterized protein n=1 Tax=Empedobacter brevis TaxID=247 RepID=A0AAJ1QGB2_9FLAO|nr:hypothetical protein [Empedobacter brevis]MDM1073546.1 hypothetical protein [Empedobacter brevis]
MKTTFFKTILISFCFLGSSLYAQPDVLSYAKQFERNKSEYIGKPFSYLLSKLSVQTQPKKAWFTPNPNNKNIVLTSTFSLNRKDDDYGNAVRLHITWQEPIAFKDVNYHYKKNKTFFTAEEKSFYGDKIVKDILVGGN